MSIFYDPCGMEVEQSRAIAKCSDERSELQPALVVMLSSISTFTPPLK